MEENNKQINIKEEVLNKIESGQIKMKSKTHFLFRLALMSFTIFFIFMISAFLISYIWFSLRTGGQIFLLSFGAKGFYNFILALPWFLLIINIFLLFFLDWLLKSFEFGYKSPILYLFMGTFVVITLAGTALNMTPFHLKMMKRAEEKKFPLPGFYGDISTPKQTKTFKGFVRTIDGNTFTIEYSHYSPGRSSTTRVVANPNIKLSDYLINGDYVFVAGSLNKDEIRAYGIKKIVLEQ